MERWRLKEDFSIWKYLSHVQLIKRNEDERQENAKKDDGDRVRGKEGCELEKKKEMVAGGLRKRRGDTIEIYIQEEGNKQLRINFYFFKKNKEIFLV